MAGHPSSVPSSVPSFVPSFVPSSVPSFVRASRASAVGYVVSSFRDSPQHSMSALRLRECCEASLFRDLLDILTLLGRILPQEITLISPIADEGVNNRTQDAI